MTDERRIAVIGLGYVGLPVAVALARKFPDTIGFDVNSIKIENLRDGHDVTKELSKEEIKESKITLTSNKEDLKKSNFFIVCVPTPVDIDHRPNLSSLLAASELVGSVMPKGSIVVYESTVYPGVTEDICGPAIEESSGLRRGKDFFLAYSPERINPGDKERTLSKIVKVVSAENNEVLKIVSKVYGSITEAGVFEAKSIKVAEAAKVIENTQRDINIALMNELALIFERMNISTRDVLAAANTKWNFLKFVPGLVGGHCIGVDPYYLTAKAQQLDYHPEVILSGRRINDNMGRFIAQKALKLTNTAGTSLRNLSVGILGLTFKENVSDIRNTRVVDIFNELNSFGASAKIYDPIADPDDVKIEYGIELSPFEELKDLDILIIAVTHRCFKDESISYFTKMLKPNGTLIDIKSMLNPDTIPKNITYWSL